MELAVIEQEPVDLTDDQVSAYIADPATIPTHEIALEVLLVLDNEIADIQTQVDAATIEANIRPLSLERQAWLRRASYAGAMRRNERHRIYQRDKEIRGTKHRVNTTKDPAKAAANMLKQERLMAEAETRRETKRLAFEIQKTAQMKLSMEKLELNERMSFARKFSEAAKNMLPEETYRAIKSSIRDDH